MVFWIQCPIDSAKTHQFRRLTMRLGRRGARCEAGLVNRSRLEAREIDVEEDVPIGISAEIQTELSLDDLSLSYQQPAHRHAPVLGRAVACGVSCGFGLPIGHQGVCTV